MVEVAEEEVAESVIEKRIWEEDVGAAADEKSRDSSLSVPADTAALSLLHICSSC